MDKLTNANKTHEKLIKAYSINFGPQRPFHVLTSSKLPFFLFIVINAVMGLFIAMLFSLDDSYLLYRTAPYWMCGCIILIFIYYGMRYYTELPRLQIIFAIFAFLLSVTSVWWVLYIKNYTVVWNYTFLSLAPVEILFIPTLLAFPLSLTTNIYLRVLSLGLHLLQCSYLRVLKFELASNLDELIPCLICSFRRTWSVTELKLHAVGVCIKANFPMPSDFELSNMIRESAGSRKEITRLIEEYITFTRKLYEELEKLRHSEILDATPAAQELAAKGLTPYQIAGYIFLGLLLGVACGYLVGYMLGRVNGNAAEIDRINFQLNQAESARDQLANTAADIARRTYDLEIYRNAFTNRTTALTNRTNLLSQGQDALAGGLGVLEHSHHRAIRRLLRREQEFIKANDRTLESINELNGVVQSLIR